VKPSLPWREMIRAALFDFGGVLAEEGFQKGLRAIGRKAGISPEILVHAGERWVYESGYVIGRATEETFWSLVRKETGVMLRDHEMREMILSQFVIRPRVMDRVRRLRRSGRAVGILSDQTDWLEELDRRHGFYPEFDHVFNSYRMGKGKKDPSLFNEVCILLRARPEEVIFVDDRKGHLERASACGMKTIHYTTFKTFASQLVELAGSF